MELRTCLGTLTAAELTAICEAVGLSPRAERKQTEAALAEQMLQQDTLRHLLSGLGDEEWAALKVVAHAGGEQGITVELCHQIVNLMSGRRRKTSSAALVQLQRRGLIFVTTRNYRQVFFVPMDLLAVLSDLLTEEMVTRVALPGLELSAVPPERDLLEDLHRFLAYIYKTEVTLTQQGQIFKRHQRALLRLLGSADLDEDTMAGRYPEPLGLLMGFALHRRLAIREEGMLKPAPDLTGWVELSEGEKLLDLFEYWRDRYYYHQDLQTFLQTIRAVGQTWVSLPAVASELEPMLNPAQRTSFYTRLRFHLISFLAPLGMFDLAHIPAPPDSDEAIAPPELACRLTASGLELLTGQAPPDPEHAGSHFVLQANFELVVARPVRTRTLWHLELIADLVSSDSALIYQVTRQSVYRALKTGMSGEEILRFLERGSTSGVPQNVAFNLADWARNYGQVYLQELTLLRCADPLLAQAIRASRRTGRFVVDQIGPTDLVVHKEDYEALMAALVADGLLPKPGIQPPPPAPAQDEPVPAVPD